MNLQLTLLIVYSVVLVAIGLSIARLVKGSADFFVAGRSLTAPLLFATVLASNIGAGATIGATGRGYFDGISAWWWNGSSAIGSVFLAFFIGPRIWRVAKEHNLFTTGDFLELRFGALVRGLVTSLIWLGTLSIFAGQLIAGAAVLSVVAGARDAGGKLADARKVLRAGALTTTPRPGENTTIGVVATNAKLTKAQASRMALMADDGLARALFPSHTLGDGDTVFALATGSWNGTADVSNVGALAADVMAEAIVRAAVMAKKAGGLPSAADIGTVPARFR